MNPTPPTVDFLYFDLGNVLLNFSHQRACQQVAEVSRLTTEQVWKIVFETPLVIQYEIGQIDDAQFHAGFCEAAGTKLPQDLFLHAFSDIFSINEPVLELACELQRRHFPMGILSNTCQAHWDFVNTNYPAITTCFSNYVLSFQESSVKPELEIYQAAIRLARVRPNRIFFIDDRLENVQGARAAGLDAVLFESAPQLKQALIQRGIQV